MIIVNAITSRTYTVVRRNAEREIVGAPADEFEKGGMAHETAKATLASLTPREQEVLKLLAIGARSKQIGAQLGISERTVDEYRSRIRWKTKARNIAELVRLAMIGGLIE